MIIKDVEELEERRLCFECVAEAFLSWQVETEGSVEQRSYCADEDPSFSLKRMSDHVAKAFEQHYESAFQARPSSCPSWHPQRLSKIRYECPWSGSRLRNLCPQPPRGDNCCCNLYPPTLVLAEHISVSSKSCPLCSANDSDDPEGRSPSETDGLGVAHTSAAPGPSNRFNGRAVRFQCRPGRRHMRTGNCQATSYSR
ncbi:hypothetical protein SAMN05518861_12959 [Mesorhizobium sp. YR577]|nr:hypothetical protein SAMN05518861_12959 [Mesorhizobium sp. YR577]